MSLQSQHTPSHLHAVSTLEAILKRHGPSAVAFFVSPNAVLTLAGARAFFDGVVYANKQDSTRHWLSEVNEYLETMSRTTTVIHKNAQINNNPRGKEYLDFFAILRKGLVHSLNSTELLGKSELILSINDQNKIIDVLAEELRTNHELEKINDDDIQHIAFGILLGYPDKAIVESIGKWDPSKTSKNERLVDAKIEHADFYHCPQPVYSYPKYLLSDPDIINHEKLWSSILYDFYKSDFHRELSNDPDFIHKARELGLYEKY